MKIVIVDDSRVMRQIVARTLRQAGFSQHEYVEACDGADALVKIAQHTPDLVLSGWNMPRKSGIELLRDLRAGGNAVPFGFVTSEGSREMRETAEKAGATFLVTKPFTAQALGEALGGVLTWRCPGRERRRAVGVPDRKQIKDLFVGLLDRDVTIGDASPVALDSRPRPTTAVYVDDRNRLSSVVLMDFPLTAWAGAALALLPKGRAEDAIDEKELPQTLLENAAELLNVLAAPIGEASGVHQRLHQTFGPTELPPSDVLARSARLGAREDVTLGIHGYGAGKLSVVSAVDL